MNYIIDNYTIFFVVFIFILSNIVSYLIGGYNMLNKFIKINKEANNKEKRN